VGDRGTRGNGPNPEPEEPLRPCFNLTASQAANFAESSAALINKSKNGPTATGPSGGAPSKKPIAYPITNAAR